jgi:hypothetical protein
MGRGGYRGGSTTIRVGEDGTKWGSGDEAATRKSRKQSRRKSHWRTDGRKPTQKEIAIAEAEDAREEAHVLRSFVSACAKAYCEKRLTSSFPKPPRFLVKRVTSAGGNIRWLEKSDRSRRAFFHKKYCQYLGREIPLEKVWGPPS